MSDIGHSIYNKTTTLAFLTQRTRLWSRLGMIGYMVLLFQMITWVFGLPDITTSQAVIIGIVTSLSTPLTAFYLRSGKELYSIYANLQYSNRTIAFIDHVGYIIDRFRIFPLIMMGFYATMMYWSLDWGMSLGDTLSMQQAAFLTTLSSSATFIFGFFITSGEVNMKLEEVYVKRHGITHDTPENLPDINTTINHYEKEKTHGRY